MCLCITNCFCSVETPSKRKSELAKLRMSVYEPQCCWCHPVSHTMKLLASQPTAAVQMRKAVCQTSGIL